MEENPVIQVQYSIDQPAPEYKTVGSAGFDLCIYPEEGSYSLKPGETKLFSTGMSFAIPAGYEVQIRSRSGLAMKGIVVTNSPGTVDADYRSEIRILLTNHGQEVFVLQGGDRVAQGVLAKVEQARFVSVLQFQPTERGAGGFGSTGFRNGKERFHPPESYE